MRKRILYISIAIFISILWILLMLNHILKGSAGWQSVKESELPDRAQTLLQDSGIIRVLLKTDGFADIAHASVQFTAPSGIRLSWGEDSLVCGAGELITITPDDSRFQAGNIWVEASNAGEKLGISSFKRGYGTPSYRGKLELFRTAEGIVIINELPLEEYLYAVVPSEMPASYELEALKTQAVCARSYAYNQSRSYGYPEYLAHVDDSTSFQVYGNSAEHESTIRAVQETNGEKIWYGNQVATAYYYSTSCGTSASITAWGGELNDANRYLQSVRLCREDGSDYEAALPWYRWTATVPEQTMSDSIELNTQTEIGSLVSLAVSKTGDGGIVQEITAQGTKGSVTVATENKIRRALSGSYTIVKQDGTQTSCKSLLPSAFFTIEKANGNYIIRGGGYGHGIGMSQNGANEMAKAGKNYREILCCFYTGVTIR
ncbi:MAG: SpoIID/LytB domain-containing protein [Faecalimonas sp.]|nr:SpoIID/LytB domain-containing protein [Faecalimonas sp.]